MYSGGSGCMLYNNDKYVVLVKILILIFTTCQTVNGGPIPVNTVETVVPAGDVTARSVLSASMISCYAVSASAISDKSSASKKIADHDLFNIPILILPI